ncbi:DUF4129 domain-containing protein [Microbacterium istanbulense]|uniref:DUF4129 domain-containing protein n=1 Tax=Microbacterium istanbulense TaxID=3122049 RepID=A0ABU8LJP1_9MICO
MSWRLASAGVFIPDGDEAQKWAEDELEKAAYQEAKPNWFDQLARDIVDAIIGLFSGDGSGNIAPFAATLIVMVLIAAIVVALIIWGRPRASRSIRRRTDLLGERDDRTAAQLRAEADRAAKSGDLDSAVVLRFRAIARALLERDLIDPAPGATAQGISREASTVFPVLSARLHDAAVLFDRVRYLDVAAAADDYRAITEIDAAVSAAAPVHAAEPEGVPA